MVAVNYLWNPINDNIVREFDDSGNTIAEYTTEPDLYGNVVSQYRNGQTSYPHYDGQGNTTELTNDAGTVIVRAFASTVVKPPSIDDAAGWKPPGTFKCGTDQKTGIDNVVNVGWHTTAPPYWWQQHAFEARVFMRHTYDCCVSNSFARVVFQAFSEGKTVVNEARTNCLGQATLPVVE